MSGKLDYATTGQLILDKSNILILSLLILPFITRDVYYLQLFCIIEIYIIFAMSINVLMGFMGQVSFGHAGFWGIGAYVVALVSTKLHFPFPVALVSAVLVSGVMGFVLGLPALRIKGHYLALLTLAFGLIVHLILLKWMSLTNGPNGVNDIPPPSFFGLNIVGETRFFFLLWCSVFISHIFCAHLKASKIGYAMLSLKEDEIGSSMVGINVSKIKLIGFAISSMVAGLSGGLYAYFLGYISPDLFSLDASILVVMIIVLGGFGNLSSPWLGSILIVGSSEYLRFLGSFREIAYGIVILLVLIFMPQGINEWLLAKTKRLLTRVH